MVKTITKIGNSQGLVFDATLMDMMHLKVGDEVNVEVDSGRTLTVTPVRSEISVEEAASTAKRLIGKNSELFRRLS